MRKLRLMVGSKKDPSCTEEYGTKTAEEVSICLRKSVKRVEIPPLLCPIVEDCSFNSGYIRQVALTTEESVFYEAVEC
jgi:hypothetical protein